MRRGTRPAAVRRGIPGSTVLNAVAYQIGWFACVLGAAGGWETLGASVAILLSLIHLVLAENPEREWPVMLAAVGLGVAVDTLHASLGVLDFRAHEVGSLAPLWIAALWLQFATVLHFCMSWLSGRYGLASLLGLVGGPLTFLAGERLGAATFGEPRSIAIAFISLSWSIVLPLLVVLADSLGGAGRYRIFSRTAGVGA